MYTNLLHTAMIKQKAFYEFERDEGYMNECG